MAETVRYLGRNSLVKRLAAQVGSEASARAILIKRGQMTKDGRLTAAGKKRDSMTAGERAVDRASKASGRKPSDYKYNSRTNRATLNGKSKTPSRRRKTRAR